MSENISSENFSSDSSPSDKRKLPPFDPIAVTRAASDALTVSRVFGTAYERDGAIVIPVAKVMGGTGSGFGGGAVGGSGGPGGRGLRPEGASEHGPRGEGEGSGGGGGFGVRVRPIGVYVVDGTGVHWRPTLDLNRVILGGQAVGVVVTLALAWVLRRRWH